MNLEPLLNLIQDSPLEWTIEESTKGLKYCIGCIDNDKEKTVHLLQVMTYEKGMIFEASLPPDRVPRLPLVDFIKEWTYLKFGGPSMSKDLYALKEKYSVCKAGTILKLMKKSRYKDQQGSF